MPIIQCLTLFNVVIKVMFVIVKTIAQKIINYNGLNANVSLLHVVYNVVIICVANVE